MRNGTLRLLAIAALASTIACSRAPMNSRNQAGGTWGDGGATWTTSPAGEGGSGGGGAIPNSAPFGSGGPPASGGLGDQGGFALDAAAVASGGAPGGTVGAAGAAHGGAFGTGGRGNGGWSTTDAGNVASGGRAGTTCDSAIIANEANGYRFSHTFTFPLVKVQPKSELTFDWSEATADFLGHAIDPRKDLDTIYVFEWNLTLDQFRDKAVHDNLLSNDMSLKPPLSYPTNGTRTVSLFDLTLNGSPIGTDGGLVTKEQVMMFFDPARYDPDTHIFTLVAASGTVLGQGTRMIQAFQLDPGSTNTTVKMTASSVKLSYTADLHSLSPTVVPAGKAGITVDWGKLLTTAFGTTFLVTDVTQAVVAHYKESPAELESKFLDLELIATDWYEGDIDGGTRVQLSQLGNSKGMAFSGIDHDGTWLLALRCGGCRSPAPLYLTVLRPCDD